jgi:rod shape determining protein RodA
MWAARRIRATGAGIDLGLLLGVLALLCVGLPAIYSASHISAGAGKVLKQAIFAGIGLIGLGVFACVDYRVLARFRQVLYALTLVLLVITLLFAPEINGARSWFKFGPVSLQPSEFAKLLLILSFGALLTRMDAKLLRWAPFLRGLLYFAIPILLVLAQPDIGTAMVLSAIWLGMVWLAGARWWMLLAVIGGFVLLVVMVWNVRLPGGRSLIKAYQKQRLDFIHADPAGAGYHQAQARIAIGAGMLWGKGYLHGTQARRGFLPEQDTDFIFAVIAEEFGLLGTLVVLGLYLFVLFRLLRIAEEAEGALGRLLVGGVAAMLAVHVLINIGMNLTLSPVTGVPLPFVSYGGSNLLVSLLSIGVVLNISRHRQSRRAWAGEEEALIRV